VFEKIKQVFESLTCADIYQVTSEASPQACDIHIKDHNSHTGVDTFFHSTTTFSYLNILVPKLVHSDIVTTVDAPMNANPVRETI
jgi:hypothetical protein